jgi:hypothetical protein
MLRLFIKPQNHLVCFYLSQPNNTHMVTINTTGRYMPLVDQIQEAFQVGYRILEPVFLDYIERKRPTRNSA